MDINPRFSAGIAFSKFAGYDFVKNSFKILEGEDVDNLSIVQNGLIVAKDYDEIIF
jgi:carbamoyl-phosphate synthase large subunit